MSMDVWWNLVQIVWTSRGHTNNVGNRNVRETRRYGFKIVDFRLPVVLALVILLSSICPSKGRTLLGQLSSPCPGNADISGYPDVISIVTAMQDGETSFPLCPDLVYNEQLNIDELGISPITLFCADSGKSCTWEVNGGSHIIYHGRSAILLTVQGIAFTGATNSSIQIKGNKKSVLEFKNCTWNGNEGSTVVDFKDNSTEGTQAANRAAGDGGSANSTESWSRGQLRNTKSSNESTAHLSFSDCLFDGNVVTKSILYADGADLVMKNCEFYANDAQTGIVTLVGGSHFVNGVTFEGNAVAESGVVYMDSAARLKATNICGFGNTVGKFCNGTFQEIVDPDRCVGDDVAEKCDSACVVYKECAVDECLSSLEDLTVALTIGGDIDLCSDTVFDLSTIDEPLTIRNIATSMKCRENCVFTGGNKQFKISDGAESVSFHGLTFADSEVLSVVVEIDPAEPAKVSFVGCEWSGHNGGHVILIDPLGLLEGSDQLEANVEITESLFSNNVVDKYVIANRGTGLSINACGFRNNAGARSLISALEGTTRVGGSMAPGSNSSKKTILVGNAVKSGLFFVGVNNTGFEADDVCGTNNTDGISCNGTFYEASNPAECRADNKNKTACEEACIPSDECNDTEVLVDSECYSEWSKLTESVASAGDGEAFIVCPGSDFVLDRNDTLYLDKKDTALQCGEDGKRSNRCVVTGGDVQIQIRGTASGVRIEGMTFVKSSNVSIAALGDGDSSATLSDCEFSGHTGESVIIVFFQLETFEGDATLPESMQVNIDACVFDNNLVKLAPITNLQGDVRVTKTAFSGNAGLSGAGAIVSYARLSVSESCFVSNYGNVSGSVLLSANAARTFDQSGNFGENNEAMLGNCTDIVTLDETSSCNEFENSECLALSQVESEIPSGITPTLSPAPSSIDSPGQSSTSVPTPVGPCYTSEEWDIMFKAISNSMGDQIFTLCDDTVVDMTAMEASDWAPLLIQASGITIRCGSARRNACVLSGGTTHIMLQGNVENIRVRGITMEQASDISVVGKVSVPFSIEFEACEWTNNTGMATVLIEANGNSTPAVGTGNSAQDIDATGNSSSRRDLQMANDNFLVCDRCLFEDNRANTSILSVSGTSLILDAVIFRGNKFDGNVASVETGSFVMIDSCVENSKSNGGVVDSKDSEVFIERIFLSGMRGTGCTGYFDADGKCADLTSTSTCIAEEKHCFSYWLDLADAISSGAQGSIFTICSGATLDVAASPAIVINRSNTTIRCGLTGSRDNDCLVMGGGIQFQILGTPSDVLFSGITFSAANITAINAAGERGSKAKIMDCLFEGMTAGQAALLVYLGDVPSSAKKGRKLTIGDYRESSDRAMAVEIAFSSFVSNAVDLAAIANLKGTVSVVDCEFSLNSGFVGAIGGWYGGSMSVLTSCFTDNTGQIAGSVFVDDDATTQKKNYGDGNIATDADCTDLLFKAGSSPGLCEEFSESQCKSEAAPTGAPTRSPTLPGGGVSPGQAPTDCIDNWDDLVSSIANDFIVGSENIFRLCPDKKLKVGNVPILLNQPEGDIWIECGPDGRLRDNCVITGGKVQFRIAATGINVSFRGVSFEKSSVMSIVAAADSQSTASFDECQWTGHSGQGVVLVYNEESGQKYDGKTPIPELPLSGDSMTGKFAKCVFAENSVGYSAVSNIGGSATFSLTAFMRHHDTLAAAVVARSGAVLSFENCCFIENDSMLPGVVLMAEESKLQKNEDNFGFDNRVGSSDCTEVWIVPPHEECSPTACPGTCSTFNASECTIPGFDFDVPSNANAPSAIPIITGPASVSPSQRVDVGLAETTLFESGYFLNNLVVAAVVTVLGFGSFFYCKSRHDPKKEGKAEMKLLSEPAPTDQFRSDKFLTPLHDSVVLDPDTLPSKRKPKKSGFFSRSPRVLEKAERRPIVNDAGVVSTPSLHTYGEYDRFEDEDEDEDSRRSDDSNDDLILS